MNIIEIYRLYPDDKACLDHLERVKWNDRPVCPYCKSDNASRLPKENRYHCNNCNTSYSVTVGTIFHNTKLDLQKWFLAISLVLNAKKGVSSRQLSRDIQVNKNTAWYMLMRIRKAMHQDRNLLTGIVEADETYIGGKEKNKHNSKKTGGTQGRNTKNKIAVAGIVERGGKIKAKKVNNVKRKTLTSFIKENVELESDVMTDEWTGYIGLDKLFNHETILHKDGEYVRGKVHTNTIEGFWSLFKRGIIGQYHQISIKHIQKYIDEFCYRYNNRENPYIFEDVIKNAVGV